LTAVLELRPSRRKAAALERVRAEAEGVFWRVLSDARYRADHWAEIAEKRKRRTALEADLNRAVIVAAARAALAEPVAHGLARDAKMAVSSYIELRAAGREASWPRPQDATAADHVAALDLLQSASTREQENTGRDALFAIARQPGPRPLTIARSHDAKLVRSSAVGGVAVVLNVLKATDRTARAAVLKPGIDASSGKEIKGSTLKTRLIVPVACSKWHENKFLSGRAILRSSVIRRVGDRWFMCAQFEFPVKEIRPTGARLGIDRGIVHPVAGAVVDRTGAVLSVLPPAGTEVGRIIMRADAKRRCEQRRCGTTSRHYVEAVNHQLHALANSIVGEAKRHGAQVVIETLDGFKQTIVTPRKKGTRKGGWRCTLKRARSPAWRHFDHVPRVRAPRSEEPTGTGSVRVHSLRIHGTCRPDWRSQHRAARRCDGRDHEGCETRALGTGHGRETLVARRWWAGAADGGRLADSGFVAAHASAVEAYDPSGLTSMAGHDGHSCAQNVGHGVFAERSAQLFATEQGEQSGHSCGRH
jgi:hypothetical protein